MIAFLLGNVRLVAVVVGLLAVAFTGWQVHKAWTDAEKLRAYKRSVEEFVEDTERANEISADIEGKIARTYDDVKNYKGDSLCVDSDGLRSISERIARREAAR